MMSPLVNKTVFVLYLKEKAMKIEWLSSFRCQVLSQRHFLKPQLPKSVLAARPPQPVLATALSLQHILTTALGPYCSLHIVRSTRFLLFEIDRVFVNDPIIFKLTNLFILYFFNKKIIREEPLNPRVLHLIGIKAYHNLWEVAAWEIVIWEVNLGKMLWESTQHRICSPFMFYK